VLGVLPSVFHFQHPVEEIVMARLSALTNRGRGNAVPEGHARISRSKKVFGNGTSQTQGVIIQLPQEAMEHLELGVGDPVCVDVDDAETGDGTYDITVWPGTADDHDGILAVTSPSSYEDDVTGCCVPCKIHRSIKLRHAKGLFLGDARSRDAEVKLRAKKRVLIPGPVQ